MNPGKRMTDEEHASASTSRSLIRRAAVQDPAAWERLSEVYTPLVYQWCRRLELQPQDAADVVQEVFRALLKSLASFRRDRPGDSFRAWLWTITRNKIRDHHRRCAASRPAAGGSAAHKMLEQIPDRAPEEDDEGQVRQVQAELAQRAMALMQRDFEPQTWQAFWKTAVENKTAPQAAEELGMSVAAVYMAKSRVLRRLRTEFDELDLIE
jgi:RNA polymerase sigma-70 factor (ECF subfamily)